MPIAKSLMPIAAVACMIVLAACSTPPPPDRAEHAVSALNAEFIDLRATYAKLAHDGAKVFAIAPQPSTIGIYVFRGGNAKLGHNHVLSAPQFSGYFYLPSDGVTAARFDLEFRLDQLEIDNPALRATLGPAFAAPQSADAIDGTRQHMLGDRNMQAAQFPLVRSHSLQISGEAPKFAAKIKRNSIQRNIFSP